jgi:exodeoxyribonuclease VII large subunit
LIHANILTEAKEKMQAITITELTHLIKKHLEPRFSAVRVQGEITNFKEQSSGHLYFTLKDAQSQISAVLFRGNASSLARIPKNGDQVVAAGELSVYPPRGNYQLIIRQMEFAGTGELLLKLHALKAKLESLGWFDKTRKKPLPPTPKTIGIVTSPTGAVIQDILHILNRRHLGFHVILNPVKVQGEGAAEEIAKAIDQFNHYKLADLLIVGRGGGSLEDLWAFNEEVVAKAIFESKIPIISAVGHETDFSIADFVADVRAPTPSAAAEICMAATEEHLKHFSHIDKRLFQTISSLLKNYSHRLHTIRRQPILSSPFALLGSASQRLDDLSEELQASAQRYVLTKNLQLQGVQKRHQMLDPRLKIATLKQKLTQLVSHLKAIDPKNLLKKGYSILFDENSSSVIFSSKELKTGQTVRLALHDGEQKAKIL